MNRYAVSDLHGQLDLFNQIKEYINEDDIVYALGDFGDRGPEPWRTLQAVLDDKQFIYLMGNHDLMLIEAIKQYLKIPVEDREYIIDMSFYGRSPIIQLNMNGGLDTLIQWAKEPKCIEYYKQLQTLPVQIVLPAKDMKNFIHLSHAGYTPNFCHYQDVDNLVWDRYHINDPWNGSGDICIHGHTPVQIMNRLVELSIEEIQTITDKGYLMYSNNSKIDIDLGAHSSGQTVLLNIDTLEGHIFKTKESMNDREEN